MDSTASIEELLRRFPDSRSPREAVRLAARDRLAEARTYGLRGPPFCPHMLASLLDIRTKPFRLLPYVDAVIVPDSAGKLTILWNDERPRKRTNFSVAHELGHTLFPHCARMMEQRQRHPGSYRGRDEIETLCDIAAAEFLMPFEEFRADLARVEPCLDAVIALSDRYQASYEATAIRLQFVDPRPVAIFVAEQLERVVPPRLRIVYAPANESFLHRFPTVRLNALEWIPAASCAYDALQAPMAVPVKREERWKDLNGPSHFLVEVMRLPVPDSFLPRVLVLLRPLQ